VVELVRKKGILITLNILLFSIILIFLLKYFGVHEEKNNIKKEFSNFCLKYIVENNVIKNFEAVAIIVIDDASDSILTTYCKFFGNSVSNFEMSTKIIIMIPWYLENKYRNIIEAFHLSKNEKFSLSVIEENHYNFFIIPKRMTIIIEKGIIKQQYNFIINPFSLQELVSTK
jgi:hypothetical protein